MGISTEYAELFTKTNFSFLEGASHPEELVARAKELKLRALAITDRNGVYGAVRGHLSNLDSPLSLIIGSEVSVHGTPLVLLATSRQGYGNLCRLLTQAHHRGPKENPTLHWDDFSNRNKDLLALSLPPYSFFALTSLADIFHNRISIALYRTLEAQDTLRNQQAFLASSHFGVPIVAVNDVHYHVSKRQPLQDVLTAIRHHTSVQAAGHLLFSNAERHLKSPEQMVRLFSDLPSAIHRSIELAEQCQFSLRELRYVYPNEFLPPGKTSMEHLSDLIWKHAPLRYEEKIPPDVIQQLRHELTLIEQLNFADYFLTIHDIVTYARSINILCQGRGSAANSAVCFVLGITSIDPVRMNLLFERFISAERGEPPDIDVDFEHERREEVIQYIYKRYGRHRAGMVAEVIRYRSRSALRDVAKALGLSTHHESNSPNLSHFVSALEGFPRHLSTHVGGFVLTNNELIESVPIQPGGMPDRTIIQWDKDDLDGVGMLKIDILGLGMLTCIRKCFSLISQYRLGPQLSLATIPAEDPRVYEMIGRADTIGVFQIESRAQMGMLPRLKPKNFHDLVVEVAIVRPGPIVGKMVHPYLRRRNGDEPVRYPHPALEPILKKTYGIPLFQEQVMKMATAVANFSPGEADQLRRAMGIWRTTRSKKLEDLGGRFMSGMKANGISSQDAEDIFRQIQSFGEFGFPESHSASFALLVYASAYLKCYHPEAFACALLNSLPMGFYSTHTIIEDALRHRVTVLPIDIHRSFWECTLENRSLRLGFGLIRGFSKKMARKIEELRLKTSFLSIEDFAARTQLNDGGIQLLTKANAFASFVSNRRDVLWKMKALLPSVSSIDENTTLPEPALSFLPMTPAENVQVDYQTQRLSLAAHPIRILRPMLNTKHVLSISDLLHQPNNRYVTTAGMVIVRQRPPTAKGMVFLTLEDETGLLNTAIPPNVYKHHREAILKNSFLIVRGKLQKENEALSVLISNVEALRFPNLEKQFTESRDFY